MQFAANFIDERINSGKELSVVCGGKVFSPNRGTPKGKPLGCTIAFPLSGAAHHGFENNDSSLLTIQGRRRFSSGALYCAC